MNTRFRHLVRIALPIAFCGMLMPCHGQEGNGTLTTGFDDLSPKERSKIAAIETKEAPEDKAYQAAMSEAEHAFQEGRYDDAMGSYGKARKLRPYNVYPKVKMEDLQALITKQAIAKAASTAAAGPAMAIAAPSLPDPLTVTVADTLSNTISTAPILVMTTPIAVEPAIKDPVVPSPAATVVPVNVTPVVARPSHPEVASKPMEEVPKAPTAVGERVFMERGAAVIERTVYESDRLVVYRRVAHKWGQVFYFKENRSITEREWKDRFD